MKLARGPYLSASEIGSFVYCPEAWYLQRVGAERSAASELRLGAGTRAHQRIGRQTDRLRDLGNARRWLLATIVLLAGVLLLEGLVGQQWMPRS
jgi:hypothetical protein